MAYPVDVYGTPGQEKETSTTKKRALGTVLRTGNGREYAYARAGAVALTPGTIVATPVPAGNHDMDLVTAVNAVGATTFVATLGATAAAKDLYADGSVFVNSVAGPGAGIVYQIDSHDAVDASGVITLKLAGTEKIVTATTTDSQSSIRPNSYSDIVITPTSVLNRTVGVATVPVAAASYGWVQTKGPSPLLISGTVVVGQHVRVAGVTTAGAVIALDRDGGAEDEQEIGVVMAPISVTTDYGWVWLNIA
jgi:hypothetical protein